jgi:hypothetical protein
MNNQFLIEQKKKYITKHETFKDNLIETERKIRTRYTC